MNLATRDIGRVTILVEALDGTFIRDTVCNGWEEMAATLGQAVEGVNWLVVDERSETLYAGCGPGSWRKTSDPIVKRLPVTIKQACGHAVIWNQTVIDGVTIPWCVSEEDLAARVCWQCDPVYVRLKAIMEEEGHTRR